MTLNSNSIITYITLIVSFSFTTSSWANRNLPREMVYGIEQTLPSNFNEVFEIKDKSSNEYIVAAHRLTLDLLHIAESSRKEGHLLQSFRMLRLTNYLFPHRGDVSEKYKILSSKIVDYLNTQSQCNENFEALLRELKASTPAYFSQVKVSQCPEINEMVADISPVIVEQEKKQSSLSEFQSFSIQERLKKMSLKPELDSADQDFLESYLVRAYLGSIEFRSLGLREQEDGVRVQFELIRKNNSTSFQGLKKTWESITGKTFKEREILFKKPLKFTVKFIQNNKVSSYPLSIEVDNLALFDVWLNTINFLNYGNYPVKEITYQNDSHAFAFKPQTIKMKFTESHQLYLLLNQIEFTNVPSQVLSNLKKVVITLN